VRVIKSRGEGVPALRVSGLGREEGDVVRGTGGAGWGTVAVSRGVREWWEVGAAGRQAMERGKGGRCIRRGQGQGQGPQSSNA